MASAKEKIMRTRWMQMVIALAGLAALGSAAACAQTDVAASLYGAFNGTTNGNGIIQSPSNAAGGLLEVRHIAKPWAGYEATYAFNRANQVYSPTTSVCPVGGIPPCPAMFAAVSANAHEVTGDWIASVKVSSFRPFALAGGGILFDAPSGGQTSTTTTTKPVFVYGAGVDWKLLPHLGLRFQYRGNLYKAPDLTTLFTSTGAFTHTAEPMIGVYFRL
jgi:opacity protein-like surface antigen